MTMTAAIGATMLAAMVPAEHGAQDIRWEELTDAPAFTAYADRGSVAGSGDLRSVTTRTVYKGALPEGFIAERIRIEEFDCVQKRSRIRRVTILANDGRKPETQQWAAEESTWSATEPDSLGEQKHEIACAAFVR